MTEIQKQASIGANFLKKFVRKVCITIKKHESAETARAELKNQIRKVKVVSLQNKKKWLVEKELKLLEKKVNDVLRHEIALLSLGKSGSFEIKELRKGIDNLQNRIDKGISERPRFGIESDKIDAITNMVLELKDRIDKLINDKVKREKKISEIELKLRRKSLLSSNLAEIEKRLRELNQSYDRIKYKTDDYRADGIQNRINFMRAKIQELW